ncbi:hypothetical protein G7K_3392-t1 [Saitoella complicata NRRL Y-17804]|uniref:MULE transposase domain-containing protein n=1 Tax=Saitoella complicata (strain BCRC 22490 / CBS 7301 / JCM 7358 / NBRC 10748 / NRRL Y-17804) TaxID=698492 RepID=A0A0E9NHE6_SAICN|nr:hypothetical protein G7K_3392-t1 [Saitoella complicata NRRL Y-17804]
MDPPPDASFPTLEELKNYAQAWAKPRGYAISTERSKPGKVWLKCTRGGEYRNRHNLDRTSRQRKSNHKAQGCPFKLVGKLSGITGDWELSTKNGEHNHEPVIDPTALPQHRKLTATQIKDVERMTKAGALPRTIAVALREDPEGNPDFLRRNIYNAKRDLRVKNLAGRTPIVALLDKLEEEGLPFRKRVDNENRITSLIFTHPQSVSFTKRFRNVFVMDCTYKTNKFEMPLCMQMLSAFRTKEEWDGFFNTMQELMKSLTEEKFEENLADLMRDYERYETVTSYVETLLPYKTYFVSAWVDRVTHLGSSVSSRAEGAHKCLKGHIGVSTGNLLTVVDHSRAFMEEQHKEIIGKIANEKVNVPPTLGAFFADIKYKVSGFALGLIEEQYILARRSLATNFTLSTCRDYLKRVFGLPCAHAITEALADDRVLTMHDIHKHWHLVLDENYIEAPTLDTTQAGGNLPMGAPGHQRFYGPPPGPPSNYFGPYGP